MHSALFKGVLIDLCARNFVHAKTSLHACCMHPRPSVQNLSSPDNVYVDQLKLIPENTSPQVKDIFHLRKECSEFAQKICGPNYTVKTNLIDKSYFNND